MNFLLRFKKEENGFGDTFLNKEELSSLFRKHNIPFTLKKVGGTPIFYFLIKHEDVPFGNSLNDIKRETYLQNGNSRIYIFEDYWITTFSGIVYQGRVEGSSHETDITVQSFKNSYIDIDSIIKNSNIKELTKYIKALYNIVVSKRYEYIEDIEPEDLIRFLISFDKKNIAIIFSEYFPEYSENMTENIIGTESSTFVEAFKKKFKPKTENYERPESFKTFIQNKLGSLNISDYGIHFSYNGKTYPSNMSIDRIHFLHGYMIDIKKACDLLSLELMEKNNVILGSETDKLNVLMKNSLPNIKTINNINKIIFNLKFLSSTNVDNAIKLLKKEVLDLKKEQEFYIKKYVEVIKLNLSMSSFDIEYNDTGFSLIF